MLTPNAKGCAVFISLYNHKSQYTQVSLNKKGSYDVLYKLSVIATQNYSKKRLIYYI